MAWQLLPTNYTDAVWNGLRKYTEITNDDGTVSFQDVTQYTNRENSFFGAREANRMNEALNAIMSMLENGTNLYTDFQNYFSQQKGAFAEKADNTYADFTAYANGLKTKGDKVVSTLEKDYRDEITAFEQEQEQVFNSWFNFVKGQLSGDIAGNLQTQIEAATERIALIEHMTVMNDYVAPIATNDSDLTVIVDDLGNSILADWKYSEVM